MRLALIPSPSSTQASQSVQAALTKLDRFICIESNITRFMSDLGIKKKGKWQHGRNTSPPYTAKHIIPSFKQYISSYLRMEHERSLSPPSVLCSFPCGWPVVFLPYPFRLTFICLPFSP